MKRPQYEAWLFNPEELSPAQAEEVRAALQEDPGLRRLEENLRQMERTLLSADVLAPAPGFVSRWRVRLAERRARSASRQSAVAFAVSLIGALALLGTAAVGSLSSPAGLAKAWMAQALAWIRGWDILLGLLEALTGSLPLLVQGALGLTLLLMLAWVCGLWLASMYRFAYREIRNGGRP